MHTAEEASRELVKGRCQRQRLYAAAGCDATSMKCFDMSSSMRVKSFFIADVFVCGMNLRSLHGTERMREIIFYEEIGCSLSFGGRFWCEFYCIFFTEVLLETRSLSLDTNDSSHGPGHKSTLVNRESNQVVTLYSNFSFLQFSIRVVFQLVADHRCRIQTILLTVLISHMMVNATVCACACVRDSEQVAPSGAENTRMSQVKLSSTFHI